MGLVGWKRRGPQWQRGCANPQHEVSVRWLGRYNVDPIPASWHVGYRKKWGGTNRAPLAIRLDPRARHDGARWFEAPLSVVVRNRSERRRVPQQPEFRRLACERLNAIDLPGQREC